MASPGNPNQPGVPPLDMHKFFNPISQNPIPNPNLNLNLNLTSSPFPPPTSASYPPPTGPYPYPPPQSSPFHHPQQQYHIPPPANLVHQRSLPYPTPSLQPPPASPGPHHLPLHSPNPNPNNPNHGARLMALLSGPQAEMQQQQNVMHVMAPLQSTSSGGSDISMAQNLPKLPTAQMMPNVNTAAMVHSSPMRMPSSKLPKGRHLIGDHAVYDIDVRLMGEVQPQLEVTPITKYGSDPGLVVGRQIAVNKSYICYGLKLGAIRVLNINTALRSLLKGLAQRVTDMAFFADDVHLLASASVDGRVYIWKITEGPGEDEKSQITGQIVMAIHITGEGDSVHPRVCWHCHKQEVLVVGIGRSVLRIDTTKVGKGVVFSAEEPLVCPVGKLIDGVQFVGNHDGEVTDLSMCQWMTTRLVSASVDGTIKIWEDRKSHPIAVLRPHDGLPVNSAMFVTSPHRPEHIILITGGPLNREVKIWTSTSEEGWLLPSDTDSWKCTQTLELKSSAGPRNEDAFFNQVVPLSQAGLLLLANAKKNAIYAVHLEYGPSPSATRMDYIAEFTVTMPILSFTGTSDLLPHGEQVVQVYCVQTQAIQQYALDLSQCLPPPLENVLERSESSASRDVTSNEGLTNYEPNGTKPSESPLANSQPRSAVHDNSSNNAISGARNPVSFPSAEVSISQEVATSSIESQPLSLAMVTSESDIASISASPLPLSPRLSQKLAGFRSPRGFEPGSQLNDFRGDPNINEYSVDRQTDMANKNFSDSTVDEDDPRKDEKEVPREDISSVLNHPIEFKHPTHLITPFEILRAPSSSETNYTKHKTEEEPNVQDSVVNNNAQNVEVEVKVVGETQSNQTEELSSPRDHGFPADKREKSFYSQAADLGIEMARDAVPLEAYIEEAGQVDGASSARGSGVLDQPSSTPEEVQDSLKDNSSKVVDPAMHASLTPPAQTTKGKKQKAKNSQGSGPVSPVPSVSNSTDSCHEPGVSSSASSVETAFLQLQTMQETLNQLMTMQKEMQKQISATVSVPVTKEGKRLETALGKSMEKSVKSNSDAMWARFQEESTKQEKLLRERTQQILNLVTNSLTKDLPAVLEKMLKKEMAAVGPALARTLSPAIEKTVSTAIAEAFQRGVGDKAVNQLEKSVNSRLEATVARHIQTQFQTSGKQILQEALKSSLETSVVPSFEMSCKAMFEQVDSTFQKGMAEHTSAAQQQFESSHSPLALALRDIMNSASTVTQTLSSELVDGQRKLLALAVAGASSNSANPLVRQQSNGAVGGLRGEIEGPLDPTKELSRLISEQKYEEAFTIALQRSDVSIVSWLCSQVDLSSILTMKTLPLSQGVLLSLLQQLACDINKDISRKLVWMRDVAMVINPADIMIAQHVRPIFEQVYQILNHQMNLPTTPSSELSSMRVVMHIINSLLVTCSK